MGAFEDLKSQWKDQKEVSPPKDGVKQILETLSSIRKGQQLTNVILAITALVLIAFFFYISAFKFQPTMIGLLLMIGVLLIRIALEFFSIHKLRSIKPLADASQYTQQIVDYYGFRQKVHFIITPLILITYCIGFYILLPGFKTSLSTGFYSYIIVSAIVVLVVLGLFIGKQILKELKVLRNLKQ